MDLNLEGSRVIVLASSKGLGRAVATEFAAEGADVVITSRSAENLQAAKEHIVDETGVDESAVTPIVCDLTDEDEIRSSMADALDALGGLDILVTNHVPTTPKRFEDTTVEEFDDHYSGVLRSIVVALKATLPALRRSNGTITHINAASALEPPEGYVFTSTFRSGLFGLSKSIANEYAEAGIRSNCVCPRGIETGRLESKFQLRSEREGISVEQARKEREETIPFKRIGDPEEFAKTTVYVSSPAASYLTGSVVPVDGGWLRSAF